MGNIISCNCHSDFQDKLYGKGFRYGNPMKKEGHYHCTVCGKDVQINVAKKEDKKKEEKKKEKK